MFLSWIELQLKLNSTQLNSSQLKLNLGCWVFFSETLWDHKVKLSGYFSSNLAENYYITGNSENVSSTTNKIGQMAELVYGARLR